MKKIIKIWSLYLIAWVFIFGQPEEDVFAESTAMLNSMEYETEDYVVRTIVEEKWENKQKLTVIIENVGDTIIDNWSVSFDMSAEIVDIPPTPISLSPVIFKAYACSSATYSEPPFDISIATLASSVYAERSTFVSKPNARLGELSDAVNADV